MEITPNVIAAANARKLLNKYLIDKPVELDLTAIANAENLSIVTKKLNNCAGKIVWRKSSGLIFISSEIKNENQQRFIIAHELGHYCNDFENEFSIKCLPNQIFGLNPSSENEKNANDFASELLMPEEWFLNLVTGKQFDLSLLKNISETFNVSITAAALKYAQHGSTPTTIILSTDGIIKWSKISSGFPFQFIRPNTNINRASYAYNFFTGEKVPDTPETILADAWFWEDNNYRANYFLNELNIPMRNYNSVLTLLWE